MTDAHAEPHQAAGPTPNDDGPPPPTPTGPAPQLEAAVSSVLLGQQYSVRMAVAAFLAGGHVLLEDVPGVGKTLFAKALARGIGGAFGRVQGTSDLLPTDLTGVSVYSPENGSWSFERGPLFNNVVLVDELNRATPRTQSALLEAMSEQQVTADGVSHPLPDPFLVVATQNPLGDLGTFPLVGGQRDRFMISLSLGLAHRDAELALVRGHGGNHALDALAPVAGVDAWHDVRASVDDLYANDAVLDYAVDVVNAVRTMVGGFTPSTRGTIDLVRFSKAHAMTAGREYLTPDDVQQAAVPVLAHRLIDTTRTDVAAARAMVFDAVAALAPPVAKPSYDW